MTDNRLLGADFIRAAACITVLFHHLAQRMSWNVRLGDGIEWFRVFTQVGTFGVAMFFVLSGFLLSRPFWQSLDRGDAMPSIRTYVLRRAARILPGFWLALTVTLVLSILVFGAKPDVQLFVRYLAGFFLVADWHWITWFPVEVNGPLWSISVEITSYVLLPFGLAALFFLRKWTGKGWLSRVLWVGVIGAAVLAHWLFTEYYRVDFRQRGWDYGLIGGAKLWMPRYNPFGFFAMFAIGSLAAGIQVRWAKYRHWIFDILGLAAFALSLAVVAELLIRQTRGNVDPSGFGFLDIPYSFPSFQVGIALALATLPSSRLVGRLLDNPVTRYVATISFGIYIWHYVVLELVRVFWAPDIDHGSMEDPTKFVIVCAVITGLTFLIAHLSYYWLEAPIMRWARGREKTGIEAATLSPAAG